MFHQIAQHSENLRREGRRCSPRQRHWFTGSSGNDRDDFMIQQSLPVLRAGGGRKCESILRQQFRAFIHLCKCSSSQGPITASRCWVRVTEIRPKCHPDGHTLFSTSSYAGNVMRGAFVVRLGAETKPKQGLFEGWVEEVDSGRELRFHSAGDLMQFLGERFRAACATDVNKSDEPSAET